jgi:transglutaminase-like putative cysteine protease
MDAKPRLPPFFLLTLLLFWGWQSDFLLWAVLLGLALESPHWLRSRWDISDKDFNQLVDLSAILMLAISGYWFLQESFSSLYTLIKGLPFGFFLLLLSQYYSSEGRIPMTALFWSLRKRTNVKQRIDFSYVYVLICLVASSVNPQQASAYLPAVIGLVSWGLWHHRRAVAIKHWGGLLLLAWLLTYAHQMALQQLNQQMEQWLVDWLSSYWRNHDPYQQTTAIGDIGGLKLSDNVLFRLQSREPLLLRETSYNRYFNGAWFSSGNRAFTPIELKNHRMAWQTVDDALKITVEMQSPSKNPLLPLPNRSHALAFAFDLNLGQNPYGVVQVHDAPAFLQYSADYGAGSLDQPPMAEDLSLPVNEDAPLKKLAEPLQLATASPKQAVKIIGDFFAQGFRYDLNLKKTPPEKTALSQFLTRDKAGHCEYFATATTLLLRLAQVPTRYATGYVAQEYSFWQSRYLVRRRHAHAWTLAYIDGQWQEIDNTPAEWYDRESARQSHYWTAVKDLFSWVFYRFNRWQWREQQQKNHAYLLWGLLPLLALLYGQLRHRKKRPVAGKNAAISEQAHDFDEILAWMKQQGWPMAAGETLPQILSRYQAHLPNAPLLQPWLRVHQQNRFDAKGLSLEEQQALQEAIQQWLQAATAVK